MKKPLTIGILGTRGIPNRYGGFEQCAEYLATGLVEKGHDVWVYNSHNHEYQRDEWNGVRIIHCKDPENKLGTFGQFIYDYNCLRDARKRNFDVLLQLGYTSNSIWYKLWPKHCKNIVNMDGLEWKRSKYSKKVQRFLRHAEKWAAIHGDLLIADSKGIQQHLKDTYKKNSVFIPYGAELFGQPNSVILDKYDLTEYCYDMLMARMEPENNIETIIKGHIESDTKTPLFIVGKTDNAFGQYLTKTYGDNSSIKFVGGIYDAVAVNNLRYYSRLYFHGHSVGGTNPSLLEAMASNALIVAHDNIFNKAVLGGDALYFKNPEDLAAIINKVADKHFYINYLEANAKKIRDQYSWARIVNEYEQAMLQAVNA